MSLEEISFFEMETAQDVMKKIASRLKEKRLKENMTQSGIAERANMSIGSLKRFEKTGEISFHSLLNIAQTLGCLDEMAQLFQQTATPASLFSLKTPKTRKRGTLK